MANNETIAEREEALVSRAETDVSTLHQMVHGDENTEVLTDGGPVSSVKKWQKDSFDFFADAANRAEAAQDAALLSAGVKDDVVHGLATTSSGEYFSVLSPESNEYVIIYKNNAGSAKEIKRYPSSAYIESLLSKQVHMATDLIRTQTILAQYHAFA